MKAVNADDVLKILHKYGKYLFVTDEKKYSSMVDEIANLKALEQEPKVGHWVEKEYRFENCWAECSICGKTASGHSKNTGWGFTYSYTDYCPNCGARMEREAEE